MNGNGQSNSLPPTADIVILGAGVVGASIAFHLAKRKAGKIVVLDKDHVGSGGSGRSSALIRMHYSFPPEVQLALVSLTMFQNWQELVGASGDFRKTGFVRIVHPHETERLKRNVEMQRKLGAAVELIDKKQLAELEPTGKLRMLNLQLMNRAPGTVTEPAWRMIFFRPHASWESRISRAHRR